MAVRLAILSSRSSQPASAGNDCGRRGRRRFPIILISIDTLRADHLPIYGATSVRTPAIDALAADGIVFDNAYAHSPQTLPSHVSILSGRLPFQHGVRDNVGFSVKPDERLLPAMLRDVGYVSGGFVSAYVLRDETGIGKSFDHFDARCRQRRRKSRSASCSATGTPRWPPPTAGSTRCGPRAFFLFFHIYEPHSPYTPPARFRMYAPYDGEIAYADEIVGSLIDSLKRRQLYDDALVVLLSDHSNTYS